MTPSLFVCPNCGTTHDANDSRGGCFLEMIVAVVRGRGVVSEDLLARAAADVDVDDFWDQFMDPAVEALEAAAKALAAPKPRRRRKGVPAAAKVSVPQPSVPTKTYQVTMANGDRKLYQSADAEQAEAMHKTNHPRDKFTEIKAVRS